jgi:hypothetical protein
LIFLLSKSLSLFFPPTPTFISDDIWCQIQAKSTWRLVVEFQRQNVGKKCAISRVHRTSFVIFFVFHKFDEINSFLSLNTSFEECEIWEMCVIWMLFFKHFVDCQLFLQISLTNDLKKPNYQLLLSIGKFLELCVVHCCSQPIQNVWLICFVCSLKILFVKFGVGNYWWIITTWSISSWSFASQESNCTTPDALLHFCSTSTKTLYSDLFTRILFLSCFVLHPIKMISIRMLTSFWLLHCAKLRTIWLLFWNRFALNNFKRNDLLLSKVQSVWIRK